MFFERVLEKFERYGESFSVGTNTYHGVFKILDSGTLNSYLDSVADGEYQLYIGFYSPESGSREPLVGSNDGSGRIRLGVLRVSEGGKCGCVGT